MQNNTSQQNNKILKDIIDEMNQSGEYSSKNIVHLSNIIDNLLSQKKNFDLENIDINSLKKHILEEYSIIHDYPLIQNQIFSFEKKLKTSPSSIKNIIQFLTDKNFFFLGGQSSFLSSSDPESNMVQSGLLKFQKDNVTLRELSDFIDRIEPNTIQKIPVLSPYHRKTPLIVCKLIFENHQLILVGIFTRKFYNLLPLQDDYLHNLIPQDRHLNFQHFKSDYEKDIEDLFYSFPNDEFIFSEPKYILQKTKKLIIDQKAFAIMHLRAAFTDEFYIVFKNDHFKESSLQKFYSYLHEKHSNILNIQKINGNKYDLVQISCRQIELPDIFKKRIKDNIEEELYTWDEKVKKIFKKNSVDISQVQVFSDKYKLYFSPSQAYQHLNITHSLQHTEKVININIEILSNETFSLEIIHKNQIFNLSEVIPFLDNFHIQVISENNFDIPLKESVYIIQKFSCVSKWINQDNLDIFKETLLLCLEKEYPRDPLNALTLKASLNHRSVQALRAYIHYLLQIHTSLNIAQAYQNCLIYPYATRLLMEIFYLRFCNTPNKNEKIIHRNLKQFQDFIKSCKSMPSIHFFESLLQVILATVRTNINLDKDYISFKIRTSELNIKKSQSILFEIFVFNHLMEGIHLRADTVSRGGLRWSDRYSDYRDEIYDLVQAQTVKNAIIVPSGSKGGFISKRFEKLKSQGASKEALSSEMVRCYTTFISGLLDITDNYSSHNNQAYHPQNVICYDELDPYLVVAADKGTAHLSDTANKIAAEYNFWLGDAFASGGKNGFSHKELAITSRGAWASLLEHMKNQKISFDDNPTFVGVGDMSGDVFGNGMLLSDKIQLIGAFDHRHIFIDPNPDPEESYKERQRLFNLPTSSWADYNKSLLSKGGGVFSRDSASIPLNSKIKKIFDFPQDQKNTTPDELIQHILKSQCDCIWFGGIGTYVKASFENNSDIADSMNHTLRVNANEIQAKIVVEGANLAVTREGRREFSKIGGSINTDGFDNSAGVNCSDHEVNFKLLFSSSSLKDTVDIHQFEKAICDKIISENSNLNTLCSKFSHDEYLQYHYLTDYHLLFDGTLFSNYYQSLQQAPTSLLELTRPDVCVLIANAYIYIKKELIHLFLSNKPYVIKRYQNSLKEYFSIAHNRDLAYENHQLAVNIIALQLAHSTIKNLGPIESMYFARHKNIFKDFESLETFLSHMSDLENQNIKSFIEFSTYMEILMTYDTSTQTRYEKLQHDKNSFKSILLQPQDQDQTFFSILLKSFINFLCPTLDQRYIRYILLKEVITKIKQMDKSSICQHLIASISSNEFNFKSVQIFCNS